MLMFVANTTCGSNTVDKSLHLSDAVVTGKIWLQRSVVQVYEALTLSASVEHCWKWWDLQMGPLLVMFGIASE